jgi:DnaJ-class molecular chaperone
MKDSQRKAIHAKKRIPDKEIVDMQKHHNVCVRCGGMGVVFKHFVNKDTIESKCPMCNGMGWVRK